MERKYIVYKHTFPNNKVYIGITSMKPYQRFCGGKGYRGSCVYNAIQKYGWDNIKHEILFDDLTQEEAEKKEIELIALYNATDKRFGYNIALGGNTSPLTEETKRKISEQHKGKKLSEETKNKISISQRNISDEARKHKSISHIGKHHSPETIIKIGIGNKGKKNTKETIQKMVNAKLNKSKPIIQYDNNYNIVKEWSSASRIEAETDYCKSTITRAIKGNRVAYGYYWRYKNV